MMELILEYAFEVEWMTRIDLQGADNVRRGWKVTQHF
jgi:hypothetical protein